MIVDFQVWNHKLLVKMEWLWFEVTGMRFCFVSSDSVWSDSFFPFVWSDSKNEVTFWHIEQIQNSDSIRKKVQARFNAERMFPEEKENISEEDLEKDIIRTMHLLRKVSK